MCCAGKPFLVDPPSTTPAINTGLPCDVRVGVGACSLGGPTFDGRVPHLILFYLLVVDRHKLTVFYHKSLEMDVHSIGEGKLRTVFVFVLAHLEGPRTVINANSYQK